MHITIAIIEETYVTKAEVHDSSMEVILCVWFRWLFFVGVWLFPIKTVWQA